MNGFDLYSARNFRKLRSGKSVESSFISVLVGFLWFGAIASLLVLVAGRFYEPLVYLSRAMAIVLGFSSLILFYISFLRAFYIPKMYIDSANVAEALSPPVLEILLGSIAIARTNQFTEISPVLILAALEKNPDGKYLLLRCGFGIEKDTSAIIAQEVASLPKGKGAPPIFSKVSLAVIEAARKNALDNKRDATSSGDILLALIQKSDIFKRLMFEIKIEEEDIKRIVEWYEMLKNYSEELKKSFFKKETIEGGIGRDWSFGYTVTLNQFARNLNLQVQGIGAVHVYGRAHEIDEIERILAKSGENNVLLIGDHGIGKKTIVKGFATKIVQGKVLPSLRYMQIFHVDTGALLSGSSDPGEIAMRVRKIFNEAARAGNIILFFDNFHALVSAKEGVGKVNTSEIILPYLQGNINVIGATTLEDYHKHIEANPGIAAVFNRIEVKEPTQPETIQILEEVIPVIEHRDGVFWPYQAIKEVVRVADRYIHNKPFPRKAIEIVDEISVDVAKSGGKVIHPRTIDELVSCKLEVPVAQAEAG